MSAADPVVKGVHWGYKQGCNFATGKCLDNDTPVSKVFCSDPNAISCSLDRKSVKSCEIGSAYASLPAVYSYTSTNRLGGSPEMDYCPHFAIGLTNRVCTNTTSITSPYTNVNFMREVFSSQSRCFLSTLHADAPRIGGGSYVAPSDEFTTERPVCYHVECAADTLSYSLKVADLATNSMLTLLGTCFSAGQTLTMQGGGGSVTCADPAEAVLMGHIYQTSMKILGPVKRSVLISLQSTHSQDKALPALPLQNSQKVPQATRPRRLRHYRLEATVVLHNQHNQLHQHHQCQCHQPQVPVQLQLLGMEATLIAQAVGEARRQLNSKLWAQQSRVRFYASCWLHLLPLTPEQCHTMFNILSGHAELFSRIFAQDKPPSDMRVPATPNNAALNEVLRQFNEETSRQQAEMQRMKSEVMIQQALGVFSTLKNDALPAMGETKEKRLEHSTFSTALEEPPVRLQLREYQTASFLPGTKSRSLFGESSVPLPYERALPQGNLGDQLKSQLVELGNFVGSLQLRAENRSAEGGSGASGAHDEVKLSDTPETAHSGGYPNSQEDVSPSASPSSFHSPSGGEENEVLRLQTAALAQSLAGLGACVVNWSSFLTASRRQHLKTMVLRYAEPCEHLSPELQELCKDLNSMDFSDGSPKSEALTPLTVGTLREMLQPRQDGRRAQPSGVLAQIAEALLGGRIEEDMNVFRIKIDQQNQSVDLIGSVVREVTVEKDELKAEVAVMKTTVDQLVQEKWGVIEAATKGAVQVCNSLLYEELEKVRREVLGLGEEFKRAQRAIQHDQSSQELTCTFATFAFQEALNERLQQMPDPTEALKAQQNAVTLAEQAAANAKTSLATIEEQKLQFESAVTHAATYAEQTQKAADMVQQSVALAESHAQKALEAKSASETSAQNAENHLTETTNALTAVQNNVALAESHAQKALEAKSASETSAQNAENNMATTTNALSAVHNNVALAESHAQKALEAKSSSETSAQNAENHLTATTNALTAVQNNVALVEDQAQKALEAKVASQRSVKSTESHVAAATNALTAVQSNADTVREKTTEVEQHSAFVKEMVQQMADQASALQATSSAVASASGKAASTLALEAEKQLAMIQEKLTQTEAGY
eukprot:symbB.v1.2.027944.t1/scaffold2901.1/size67644/3